MRSTIFTSLLAMSLTGVMAQAGGPAPGCYLRVYDAAHLARNPAQIVEAMKLKVYIQPGYGETVAGMKVKFANQGRLRGSKFAGQILEQFLICWTEGGRQSCAVECDGGSFVVTRETADSLTFETSGLWVGDTEGCGGSENIAEVMGQPVKYRLNRIADSECEDF